ncbi:hypothetical protein W97_07940 [Coniosporium apollinis CBS 100218]|uniref:Heterokaryon incompatibility domain-containing protein n=1 Tax=Coniosporium apollinis (strain CBS 100218) TaxID=1168221 RepID=R7Z3E8_CONA1|nr:uncharacterized protein W97_07940 [Coniosporium apollinis CBS 100218]EON68682.1 hypothetical protein W97_07940 [Coniosporium apollinis CBS 100218]
MGCDPSKSQPYDAPPQVAGGQALYHPLNADRREIRLLIVPYAEVGHDAPIRCSLVQASLDKAPKYEALSYVWGDASDSVPLQIGNHTLQITRNLDTTLRHLRNPGVISKGPDTSTVRAIWIDAICINQNDILERNTQVRFMFDVYKSAARVLVWLGEARDISDAALDLVLKLAASQLADVKKQLPNVIFSTEEQALMNRFPHEERWYLVAMTQLGPNSGTAGGGEWEAFQKLMERPWWRRTWVVQELAAAGKRAIIGCGSKWIFWDPFIWASLAMCRWQGHPLLQGMRELDFAKDCIGHLTAIGTRLDQGETGFRFMANLLYHTKTKQATMPVDRIYDLLGLASSIPMVPDYAKSPEEGNFGADGALHVHGALQGSKIIPQPSAPGDQLVLNGILYDHPGYLSEPWQGSARDRDGKLFTLLQSYENAILAQYAPQQSTDATGQPLELNAWLKEPLWQTLVWNSTPESKYPAPNAYDALYDEMTSSTLYVVDGTRPLPAELNDSSLEQQRTITPTGTTIEFYRSVVKHSLNRRLFITQKGHLGSGPLDMRHDDLVCVIFGFKMPVILRQRGEYFEWIGQAYVHGIMHGGCLVDVLDKLKTFRLV